MNIEPRAWQPDRSWADPLIGLLLSICLLASGASLWIRQAKGSNEKTESGPTIALRIVELQYQLIQQVDNLQPGVAYAQISTLAANLKNPWDRAGFAVLLRETKDPKVAERLALDPNVANLLEGLPKNAIGSAFRETYDAAFDGKALPSEATRSSGLKALQGSRAALLLENRLREREGLSSLPLPAAPSILKFMFLGAIVLFLFLGGLVFSIFLFVTRKAPRSFAPPTWEMSGRAVLIVFLAWFTAHFLWNFAAQYALRGSESGRLISLPLGYALSAFTGASLIRWAEGLSWRELWHRVAPGRTGRSQLWGLGFLSVALFSVAVMAVVMAPILKGQANPQQELLDLFRQLRGWGWTLLLLCTVAVMAPFFEELMFRGFLLPWLGQRWRWGWALAISSLLFGAIHLQPIGLPTLSLLGFVMGLAMLRTGNLWTSIVVHGLWNGSIFMLMRSLG
jgi:membrane protease YdiL (CAAX protease family)